MTPSEPYEPPDVRRARRLAEAKAARHSPERLAMVAELQRRKVEADALAAAEREAAVARAGTRSSGGSSRPRSTGSRAPKPVAEATVFGHPLVRWLGLRDAALARLAALAAERRTTTPADLWADLAATTGLALGDPGFQLPRLLSDVAAHAAAADGVLPNALVVESEATGPGRRFFVVAKELDRLPDTFLPEGEGFRLTEGLRRFWTDEVEATFERYAAVDEG